MDQVPADAHRAFTTTVGLITTHDGRGPNVMAAEWTFNVSYDPFLIMVVVRPVHATHEAIAASKEFGVSLCSEDQSRLASFAGHFSKDDTEKLSSELFETYPAKHIRAPLIQGALLNAECKLVDSFPVGDHTAFVGEVIAATWDPSKRPLVLHRGSRRLGDPIPRVESLSATATPMRASQRTEVTFAGQLTSASPLGDREVSVELRTLGGDVVARTTAKTNSEGYYDVRWRLPNDLAARTYTIVASVGDVVARARLVVG